VPFIVALNKIDRIYGWKATPDNPVHASLAAQDGATLTQFQNRVKQTRLELNEQGLNAELYFENNSLEDTVSMVPTSAHTGEGIQDLLLAVMQYAQERLTRRIMCVSQEYHTGSCRRRELACVSCAGERSCPCDRAFFVVKGTCRCCSAP
jgi:translation initiation factor 5B